MRYYTVNIPQQRQKLMYREIKKVTKVTHSKLLVDYTTFFLCQDVIE